KLGVGSWALEVGRWKLGVGSWTLEVGSWTLEVGSWELGVGSWKLGVGSWELGVGRCGVADRLRRNYRRAIRTRIPGAGRSVVSGSGRIVGPWRGVPGTRRAPAATINCASTIAN